MRYAFEGVEAEQRDAVGGLQIGFTLAMFGIFALLAIPLKSYIQPLIIMSAIPFGFVGAVWGHIFMGENVSMMSTMGIVALSGVVVNDSLVLVDFVNRHRRTGASLVEAVQEAGAARFRPILLTSLTTFAGLAPLLFEQSTQADFLKPMAISLAFGVIFATFITLVLVPTSYMILEDIKWVLRRVLRRPGTRQRQGSSRDTSWSRPDRSPSEAPYRDTSEADGGHQGEGVGAGRAAGPQAVVETSSCRPRTGPRSAR